jgi:hypothetical protein
MIRRTPYWPSRALRRGGGRLPSFAPDTKRRECGLRNPSHRFPPRAGTH